MGHQKSQLAFTESQKPRKAKQAKVMFILIINVYISEMILILNCGHKMVFRTISILHLLPLNFSNIYSIITALIHGSQCKRQITTANCYLIITLQILKIWRVSWRVGDFAYVSLVVVTNNVY